ncbi:MAG TPA: hypothetical protein QF455_02615, partial [Phycisphaerales bacterium]|nr:hypothetical protein [Phycisphaerales bacterium]
MSTNQEGEGTAKGTRGRAHWKSRTGFILAAAGSAVGLGNIWKFPYITGENGGGLFVLIYLVCIALVGLPILIAEIMIGRAAQAQPVEAFKRLQGGPTGWSAVGWLGVVAGFLILSFYIVVAGWAMDYTLKSVVGFTNPIGQKASDTALIYKATEPVESMRVELAEHDAADPIEHAVKSWRRQFAPSTWKHWQNYQEAAAAEGVNSSILLEDPAMKAAFDTVEPALPARDAAVAKARAAATLKIAEMSDEDVREAATTLKRRSIISSEVTSVFMGLLSDGWTSTFWASIFMFLTILVVASGVGAGIERACRVMMPLLLLFI